MFRSKKSAPVSTTDNGVLGPTFLEAYTVHSTTPKELMSHEWGRALRTPPGQTRFKIKYHGRIHENIPTAIVRNDEAPLLVLAVDDSTGQEILLHDGCIHGYDAMFCYSCTPEQFADRPTVYFVDPSGEDTFEIVIVAQYAYSFDEDYADAVDDDGFVELANGSKCPYEVAKRNSFDWFFVWATNSRGETMLIVDEELA